MLALACEGCGASLSAADVDRRLAIATCGHCGALYDLTRRTGRQTSTLDAEAAQQAQTSPTRAPAAMPARFDVDRSGDELTIRWRWFSPKGLFLLFFAIAWDSFLVT
ncbi:MAG: hypothetical protein ACOCUS_06875 [Polyangiales bacterium]